MKNKKLLELEMLTLIKTILPRDMKGQLSDIKLIIKEVEDLLDDFNEDDQEQKEKILTKINFINKVNIYQ